MTHDEAIVKQCVLGISQRPSRPWMPIPLPNCIGKNCVAYWRWLDETHVQGYCSLGPKPEF